MQRSPEFRASPLRPVPSVSRALQLMLDRVVCASQTSADGEEYQQKLQTFVDELKGMPVAVQTLAANEQHYEVRFHVRTVALLVLP